MDPKDLLAKAIEGAGSCIRRVTEADFGKPTPCSEWNLHQLLNHIVYELLWVPDLLMSKTIAEVGNKYDGDVLHSDPLAAWQHAADAALVAAKHADLTTTVHLSYGDKSVGDYLNEIAADVLVHGWDLGRSLKCSVVFAPEVAQAVYNNSLPRKDEFAKSGLFGTPFEVSDDASVQVKLLALMGRHADIEP